MNDSPWNLSEPVRRQQAPALHEYLKPVVWQANESHEKLLLDYHKLRNDGCLAIEAKAYRAK